MSMANFENARVFGVALLERNNETLLEIASVKYPSGVALGVRDSETLLVIAFVKNPSEKPPG